MHHTGQGEDLNLVNYLATNPAQVSCHYVVTTTGIVYQIADDIRCTWHAGLSARDGKKDINNYGIGIEIVSDGYTFTNEQKISVRKLVSHLMSTHNRLPQHIIRHKDIAPGRKRDVGDNFWNTDYNSRSAYQESYALHQTNNDELAEQARQLGIRNGMRPQDPATRKEVAIMIMRAMDILGSKF